MISLILELTNKCNLNCKWCGVKHLTNSLSLKQIRQIIELNKPKFVELTGGEPLLHKDIVEIVNYLKSKRIWVSINTNGTLVTDKLAKELDADLFRVSIDGTREINDKIRGKGAFRKAIRGIKSLKKSNKKIIISTAIGKTNKDNILELIKELRHLINNFMIGRVLPTPELGYTECISGFEAFLVYLRLLPYRLNPLLHINFAMQFGAFAYFNFVPPEVLSNGDVISCCINRGDKIGNVNEKKKLRSKPCLLVCSSCNKCVKKYV